MDNKTYKIGLIGAGKLAAYLIPALHRAGQQIVQVISRSEESARSLAQSCGADYSDQVSSIRPDLDILLLTTPDQTISEIINEINWFEGVLAHTSGSVSIDEIHSESYPRGVFYPLQTFSANRQLSFSDIPVFVEGSDEFALSVLTDLAGKISRRVNQLESEKRAHLHLAAVFANNFTNYLLTASNEILNSEGIDISLMDSLLRETFEKALANGPEASQTGPAVRGDNPTIKKHLKLLSFSPELTQIYKCLSESMQNYYGKRVSVKKK